MRHWESTACAVTAHHFHPHFSASSIKEEQWGDPPKILPTHNYRNDETASRGDCQRSSHQISTCHPHRTDDLAHVEGLHRAVERYLCQLPPKSRKRCNLCGIMLFQALQMMLVGHCFTGSSLTPRRIISIGLGQ